MIADTVKVSNYKSEFDYNQAFLYKLFLYKL